MSETSSVPKLLLSAQEAAQALGVSPRTLWAITRPRGDLPCIIVGPGQPHLSKRGRKLPGGRVMYRPEDLRTWCERKAAEGGAR